MGAFWVTFTTDFRIKKRHTDSCTINNNNPQLSFELKHKSLNAHKNVGMISTPSSLVFYISNFRMNKELLAPAFISFSSMYQCSRKTCNAVFHIKRKSIEFEQSRSTNTIARGSIDDFWK